MNRAATAKISIVIPSLQGGGGERVALFMTESLASAGYDVDLVVACNVGALVDHPTAVRHRVDLGAPNEMLCLPRLVRYLKRTKPDLVIAAMHTSKIMAGLAKFLIPDLPLAISVHNHLDLPRSKRFWFRAAFGYLPERWLYRNVIAAHVVSNALVEQVARNFHLPVEKIWPIYNPVLKRVTAPEMQASHSIWFDKPVLITVGRLVAQKNHAGMIRAFDLSDLKGKAKLLILGEGALDGALKAQCHAAGLENDVLFGGWVPDTRAYMAKARGFVMSSDYEGFALVLVEALANGLPIVSYDTPVGPREVLDHGKLGRLTPCGNEAALAQGMRDIMSGAISPAPPPAVAAHLARFAPETIRAQYIAFTEACLSNRAG
jgi:glycosyltransferase involved in cell wall biosynthesis